MSSQGSWFLVAQHVHRTPHPQSPAEAPNTSSSYKGFYNLSRNLHPQEDFLIMALTFSALSSPFTFSGSVSLQKIDLDILGLDEMHNQRSVDDSITEEIKSGFQIHGSGSIVKTGSSDEVFESTFQITTDSGTGKYLGINGSGKLEVHLSTYEYDSSESEEEPLPFSPRSESKSGRGRCTFEFVNAAGTSLM
jgi:hypothetical protein